MTALAINLEVNDKGSVVVDRFTDKTVSKVKQMSRRSSVYIKRMAARFATGLGGAVSGVGRSLLNLKTLAIGALAGWGLGRLIQGFIDTGSAMDQMKLSLDTITKGRGQEWFDKLNEWALTMPVNTEKAIQSFIMMRAMGLKPSIDQMTVLVDTMSALGGGADTMEGIARALGQIQTKGKVSSEELMQLAERGVPVFEILKESFGEVETASLDAGKAIAAIFAGMAERFGGQSSKIQNKWAGLTESLKSYWTDFKKMVMESGVMTYLETALKTLTDKIAAMRRSGDLEKYARDVGTRVREAGTTALNTIAAIIESIPKISMAFAGVGQAMADVSTYVVAFGSVLASVMKIVAPDHMERLKQDLDDLGVKAAEAALKFEQMGTQKGAQALKAQQAAENVRAFAAQIAKASEKQVQAEKKAAQKTATVWKEKIIQINGVWTNVREKINKQALEPKVKVKDQATSPLKKIQAEMAKIKDKTVRVKVVHTGTGSTERPLTHKINEILGMYKQMPSNMAMNMDMTQVTGGLNTLLEISSKLANVEHRVAFNRQMADLANLPYRGSGRAELGRLETLYNAALSSMSAPAGRQGSGSTSTATSVSVDQLNINVPNALPQTTEDWRMIVREHVIPELERVGHA